LRRPSESNARGFQLAPQCHHGVLSKNTIDPKPRLFGCVWALGSAARQPMTMTLIASSPCLSRRIRCGSCSSRSLVGSTNSSATSLTLLRLPFTRNNLALVQLRRARVRLVARDVHEGRRHRLSPDDVSELATWADSSTGEEPAPRPPRGFCPFPREFSSFGPGYRWACRSDRRSRGHKPPRRRRRAYFSRYVPRPSFRTSRG
jgi:hypothetical protein